MNANNVRSLPVEVNGLMCEARVPESIFETEWDELHLSIDQIFYDGIPITLWANAAENFTSDSQNCSEPS